MQRGDYSLHKHGGRSLVVHLEKRETKTTKQQKLKQTKKMGGGLVMRKTPGYPVKLPNPGK